MLCALEANSSGFKTHFCKEEIAALTSPSRLQLKYNNMESIAYGQCPVKVHGFGLPSTDDSASFRLPDVKGEGDPLWVKSASLEPPQLLDQPPAPSCHCSELPSCPQAFPRSTSPLDSVLNRGISSGSSASWETSRDT